MFVCLCTNTVCFSSSPSSVVFVVDDVVVRFLAGWLVTLSRCYCSGGKLSSSVTRLAMTVTSYGVV